MEVETGPSRNISDTFQRYLPWPRSRQSVASDSMEMEQRQPTPIKPVRGPVAESTPISWPVAPRGEEEKRLLGFHMFADSNSGNTTTGSNTIQETPVRNIIQKLTPKRLSVFEDPSKLT